METRLKIIREVEPKISANRKYRMVECLCECGNKITIRLLSYKTNNTKSCGCLNTEKRKLWGSNNLKHGHSNLRDKKNRLASREYKSWINLKQRCNNPNNKDWDEYGGRGIKVCDRWLNSFENFLTDMGERPRGYSIDRIDPNGNYEPSNCRWADNKTQRHNQRVRV
jgi:hypothetical protein